MNKFEKIIDNFKFNVEQSIHNLRNSYEEIKDKQMEGWNFKEDKNFCKSYLLIKDLKTNEIKELSLNTIFVGSGENSNFLQELFNTDCVDEKYAFVGIQFID